MKSLLASPDFVSELQGQDTSEDGKIVALANTRSFALGSGMISEIGRGYGESKNHDNSLA